MSAQQSFLRSRECLAHKLEVLIASVEDLFDAQANLYARAVFREEMEHLSRQTEVYTRCLALRHREFDAINTRLGRLLHDCDNRADAQKRNDTAKSDTQNREALIDLVYSSSSFD